MKEIKLQCCEEAKNVICDAILIYVNVMFPQGCADCSLAAREALLNAIERIQQTYQPVTGEFIFNKRLKPMTKEALINYYNLLFEKDGINRDQEKKLMIYALDCEEITKENLQNTKMQDRLTTPP